MKLSHLTLICSLILFASGVRNASAHEHFAAGASGTTLVLFDSMGQPMLAENPKLYHLVWESSPRFTGYYSLADDFREEYPAEDFTFSASSYWDEEDPSPAPLGTQIWMSMTLLSGPDGGTFSFWNAAATAPTFNFLADGSSGSFNFILSQPATVGVLPENQDPWGHIHGRAFTATLPGDYWISFSLYDGSGLNKADPSQAYTFHFVVVPEPATSFLAALGIGFLMLTQNRRRRN